MAGEFTNIHIFSQIWPSEVGCALAGEFTLIGDTFTGLAGEVCDRGRRVGRALAGEFTRIDMYSHVLAMH
jgi:hypothetical protein